MYPSTSPDLILTQSPFVSRMVAAEPLYNLPIISESVFAFFLTLTYVGATEIPTFAYSETGSSTSSSLTSSASESSFFTSSVKSLSTSSVVFSSLSVIAASSPIILAERTPTTSLSLTTLRALLLSPSESSIPATPISPVKDTAFVFTIELVHNTTVAARQIEVRFKTALFIRIPPYIKYLL